MTFRGHVSNGVVVLENPAGLPNGTVVAVTPLDPTRAPDAATTEAAPPGRVSNDQRDAFLGLIGIWKTDRPPDDAEVDRIVDDYRTRKHG